MFRKRGKMNKNKMNICLLIMVALLGTSILSGCSKKEQNNLRIGYFPNITHSQALVMKERGGIEKKLDGKYDVRWTSFNAGPAEVEALFAGELDMGFIGPVPVISAYVKSGGEFVIVSGVANGGALLVAGKDSGIHGVADLGGKKVAIPQLGNTQHLMLLNLLKKNNLDVTSSGGTVELVAAANADITNLIDQKQIDAAFVPEPWGSIITQNSDAFVVSQGNGMDAINQEATTVIIINKNYMQENKEAINTFLEEYYDATDYVIAGSEEMKQLVNKSITEKTGKEMEKEVVNAAFENLNFTTEVPQESLNDYAIILYDQQYITSMPDEKLIYKD